MLETVVKLILCHLVGDYVLQCDYVAKTKGDNMYHMFVHCALYIIPFMVVFGFNLELAETFVAHFVVDLLKARYKKIGYVADQVLHYVMLGITYLFA